MANFSAGDLVVVVFGFRKGKPKNNVRTYKISSQKDKKFWELDLDVADGTTGLVITRFVDDNDYAWYDVLLSDRQRPSRIRGLRLMRLTNEFA